MNDELKCAGCAAVLGYFLPLENRDTAGAFQLSRNYIATATHADGRRIFTHVAKPRAFKNHAEVALIRARQTEADESYYQSTEEERREVDELRATGVLMSWADVARDEKEKPRNPKARLTIYNIIEVSECVTGFYVGCKCGAKELVTL